MTQSVSVLEIQAAGGLEKWAARVPQAKAVVPPAAPAMARTPLPSGLPAAKGRKPSDSLIGYDIDRMNGLEARYAGHLEGMRRTGRIIFWRFESVKFRLADRTWYTPDFYVMQLNGSLEIHETKGWMEEDANVKIKTVAELFPELSFILVRWRNNAWEYKRYRQKG